jgi:hypothetical protein
MVDLMKQAHREIEALSKPRTDQVFDRKAHATGLIVGDDMKDARLAVNGPRVHVL